MQQMEIAAKNGTYAFGKCINTSDSKRNEYAVPASRMVESITFSGYALSGFLNASREYRAVIIEK